MSFPDTCRACGERTRMRGNYMCPVCHPDTSPEDYDGELVDVDDRSGVRDSVVGTIVALLLFPMVVRLVLLVLEWLGLRRRPDMSLGI